MTILCAISGEIPTRPVVSKLSGRVYERSLLEKALAQSGRDPISGDPLTFDDVVELKVSAPVHPRPPSATSIPALLAAFQSEWDATALEVHSLRRQLEEAKRELAKSLYEHDAACRVIARLVRERDAAKNALGNLHTHLGAAQAANDEMDVDHPAAPATKPVGDFSDSLLAKNEELSAGRRKRKAPSDMVKPDSVSFEKTSEVELFNARPTCVDVCADGEHALAGSIKGHVSVFSGEKKTTWQALPSGQPVLDVMFSQKDVLVAGGTAGYKVFVPIENGYKESIVGGFESSSTVSFASHPLGNVGLAASETGTIAFVDFESGKHLVRVRGSGKDKVKKIRNHPDGLIFATGLDSGVIHVYDAKEMSVAATLSGAEGHSVESIVFSENGYHLLSSHTGGKIKLWDLRKAQLIKEAEGSGHGVAVDNYGVYSAFGDGDVVKVYPIKQFNEVASLSVGSTVCGVGIHPLLQEIVAVGVDGRGRTFKLQ